MVMGQRGLQDAVRVAEAAQCIMCEIKSQVVKCHYRKLHVKYSSPRHVEGGAGVGRVSHRVGHVAMSALSRTPGSLEGIYSE